MRPDQIILGSFFTGLGIAAGIFCAFVAITSLAMPTSASPGGDCSAQVVSSATSTAGWVLEARIVSCWGMFGGNSQYQVFLSNRLRPAYANLVLEYFPANFAFGSNEKMPVILWNTPTSASLDLGDIEQIWKDFRDRPPLTIRYRAASQALLPATWLERESIILSFSGVFFLISVVFLYLPIRTELEHLGLIRHPWHDRQPNA